MARLLTERMAQALIAGRPRGLFVSIDHPSGTGYFCTGIGSRSWNGHVWSGIGTLGSVTPVKRSSEIAVQDITFTLSGVDADIVAKLSDDVHNRSGDAWLACFDERDNVVPDPYKLLHSELDTQAFSMQEDGTCTISIVAHTGFYVLARAIAEAWTPENQKARYPGDTGLDMIPALVNQDLQWTPT